MSLNSKTENFKIKANLKHNFKFDYTKTNYITAKTKVIITCNKHGEFSQEPSNHLQGQGCKYCQLDTSGWSTKERFNIRCMKNNCKGILYIIHCFNENESFYKIGITSRSIKERYGSKYHMPYNYEVIQEIIYDPNSAWGAEKFLHRECKKLGMHYVPRIIFGGHLSECFKLPQQNH